VVLGLLCAAVVIVFGGGGVIFAAMSGWNFTGLWTSVYMFLYFLVFVALVEESLFRGYIQTRMFGLFKTAAPAVVVTGIMFALYHIPFQLVSGNQHFGLNFMLNLLSTFVFHLAAYLIFIKYNSIYGAIVFHALNDWINSGCLFITNTNILENYVITMIMVVVLAIIGVRYLYVHRRMKTNSLT